MSDYALDDSPPSAEQPLQQHGSETPLLNLSLDDPNAANNSLIGKVKSRVSSIFPNRLSKWFSPSTKLQNDSLNGGVTTSNAARRRRRIEVEDDEDDDDNYEDHEIRHGEYEENHNLVSKQDENSEGEDDEDDEDDGSQNSEEEYTATVAAQKVRHGVIGRQPPAKRTRLSADIRDSPLIAPRQPLIASTPAVGSTYMRSSMGTYSAPRSSYQRLTNLNLYGHQSKKEPAYNFSHQKDSAQPKINTDIIELISNPPNEIADKLLGQSNIREYTGISSRRSLNIQSSSTSARSAVERVMNTGAPIKRQPLSTSKTDLPLSLTTPTGVPPRRTSTTIHEVKDSEEQSDSGDQEESLWESNMNKYNGQFVDETSNLYSKRKRQKHINGSGSNQPAAAETNETIILDTASESGESCTAITAKSETAASQKPLRKTGLFNTNMSVAGSGNGTTRNSSRTSSFGNGLNFYSHLEGRKSLFTGPSHDLSNALNNSTLSLTSLNRRQFNASIYGSTSALSDSRLLNTFSPFYKGKTTYGGAAAYNKYSTGTGASAVRITPTLIRPTSSLSTLSSSNNSLAHINANHQQIGEGSTISSTAKRILDLINDFATPLSEAKKMANNLKTMPTAQTKGRLNENDLNASRAIRLSQVRTPYARPAVILQPSGNANGGRAGLASGPLPPVQELQVPTMSQLLQMKKIQTTTEKARNITRSAVVNASSSEYSLPVQDAPIMKPSTGVLCEADQQQQKHTNKMKNKVSNSLRASAASKDLQDEAPPPVNLPNIAFPLMQSVPKFDIQFSKSSATPSALNTTKSLVSSTTPTIQSAFSKKSTPSHTTNPSIRSVECLIKKPCTPAKMNFTFSEPLVVKSASTPIQHITPTHLNNYKFSPPLEVRLSSTTSKGTEPQQPQLKTTGSCLDVLSKPLSLPLTNQVTASSFGDQFKKSAGEWECEACMIRNKSTATKCVACETPRKQKQDMVKNTANNSSNTTLPPLSSTFGQQFKKSSSEWECDVCMIRNKEESSKCVACETPRKGLITSVAPPIPIPSIKNSFGDAFKSKSGTWECPTCMISNKNEANSCVACETKKPGSTISLTVTAATSATISTFKFGFSTPQTTISNASADAGFKSIAAQQKLSKWECDACMTRNDAERTKCACCGQPKPGSTTGESSSSPTTKFSFGATSAAKFSFGFGTASNAAKEEDLRKEKSAKAEEKKPPTTGLGFVSSTPTVSETKDTLPVTGFQFGVKSNVSVPTQQCKKDETDAKISPNPVPSIATAGFKFGVTDMAAKKPETTSSATSTAIGFQFGSKPTESSKNASTTTTSSPTAPIPSVKFSLPSTSSTTSTSIADKPTGIAAPTFSFGSNAASSTTEGFSFGGAAKKATLAPVEEKKAMEGFAFKAPANVSSSTTSTVSTPVSGFVFGSPATKTNNLSVTQSTAGSITTSSASTVTTAAVKPMFSFGSSAPNAPATSSAGGFGGFKIGSSTPASASTEKPLFGAVTSTSSTTNTTSSTNSTTTSASASSIFGSFGGTASPALTFGSSSATPSANPAINATTVSSSTSSTAAVAAPTFGSLGGSNQTPTNVFGSFGSASNQTSNLILAKPIVPVFGNVASSSSSTNASPSTFVFGSAAANASTPVTTTTSINAVTINALPSTSWPKNSFVFGSANTAATPAAATQSTNGSKDVPKPSVFGSFGSGATETSNQQTTSIFGNAAAATPPAFGSAGAAPANTSTNLFAATSAPAATNIFGANPSGNAATPAPAFGSSPFGGGGSASSTSATPTFGSTAITGSATFGGFGGTAVGSNTTTNPLDIKKPEPAFNFGSAAPAAQSTSGGFNFGSSSSTAAASATKPAFNFGGATAAPQPTFNFTGSSEPQNAAKPFQFGAIPSAPVFNFGGGAIEATPNAPFQFNAGTAPVSSNIFAPAPTPGAQTAQQAKRKIRAPIRRVTQR